MTKHIASNSSRLILPAASSQRTFAMSSGFRHVVESLEDEKQRLAHLPTGGLGVETRDESSTLLGRRAAHLVKKERDLLHECCIADCCSTSEDLEQTANEWNLSENPTDRVPKADVREARDDVLQIGLADHEHHLLLDFSFWHRLAVGHLAFLCALEVDRGFV